MPQQGPGRRSTLRLLHSGAARGWLSHPIRDAAPLTSGPWMWARSPSRVTNRYGEERQRPRWCIRARFKMILKNPGSGGDRLPELANLTPGVESSLLNGVLGLLPVAENGNGHVVCRLDQGAYELRLREHVLSLQCRPAPPRRAGVIDCGELVKVADLLVAVGLLVGPRSRPRQCYDGSVH